MAYGSIKVDTIVFTNNSADQSVSISGIIASTSGNLTVTGTISGSTVQATYGTFTNLTGVTTTGTTANFVTLSGTTVTGTTAQFTSITGGTAGFTTVTGTTVTGTTANFVTLSGTTVTGTTANFTSGVFTNISGITATFTSGIIASGTALLPSLAILLDPNTGIYSPGADQVAVATNGTQKLIVLSNGNVGIGTGSPAEAKLCVNGGISIEGTYSNFKANIFTMDNNGGNSRLNSFGPNITTPGSFDFIGFSSNALVGAIRMSISSAGTTTLTSAAATAPFVANIGASEAARIDSSGRLLVGTVTGNANGGILQLTSGITFPATPVAATDVNTLDDYEEGTWEPTFLGSTTNPTQTYNLRIGRYVKIGRSVFVTCRVLMVNTGISGGTGDLSVGNLPFTSANVTNQFWGISVAGSNLSTAATGGIIINSSSEVVLLASNSSTTVVPASVVANNSNIVITGWYEV